MKQPIDWTRFKFYLFIALMFFFVALFHVPAKAASPAAPTMPGEVACVTSACTIYNQAFAHVLTGDRFTISIGDSNLGDPVTYVWELHQFPQTATSVKLQGFSIANGGPPLSWNLSIPRSGLYFLRIKACVTSDMAVCSRWAYTYDPVDTDPVRFPRGFVVEVKVKPPTL